ncbi:MAG: alkaline phosphatase family protein [Methanobacteriota archaeon]|nr:MAG: alkaline phosphatase family protein [Euryarchaeota archaeon]
MPARVIVLGIDGLDYEVLQRHLTDLPNMGGLCHNGECFRLNSTIPPDSETAWATIFTGLNPAEHGLIRFIDPLEKSISYMQEGMDASQIRGKCIWDLLSEQGHKVCVLLPHAAYPPWDVNGIMVSRSSATNDVACTPRGVISDGEMENLKAPRGFPGRSRKSMQRFLDSCTKLSSNTEEVALRFLDAENWDFFFVYSPVLDIVSHFFWKYYDAHDPSYPGRTAFGDSIPDLYKAHDEFVGELSRRRREGDVLIVVSDHGHGRRPLYEFKMNELFRQRRLLTTTKRSVISRSLLAKLVVDQIIQSAGRLGLENIYSVMLGKLPNLRTAITSPKSIAWDTTKAAMTDLSGIKSYNYGGIRVNTRVVQDDEEYESLRDTIIEMITKVTDPRNRRRIARWARRREEVYSGKYIERFPDIVYELNPEYGFSPVLGEPLLTDSRARSIVPGTHIGLNAVLIIGAESRTSKAFGNARLGTLAGSVIRLFNLDCPQNDIERGSGPEGQNGNRSGS